MDMYPTRSYSRNHGDKQRRQDSRRGCIYTESRCHCRLRTCCTTLKGQRRKSRQKDLDLHNRSGRSRGTACSRSPPSSHSSLHPCRNVWTHLFLLTPTHAESGAFQLNSVGFPNNIYSHILSACLDAFLRQIADIIAAVVASSNVMLSYSL